ncbi:MAG: leucine-rich repeat domain-containing protein [Holosporales bacterium]|jgi:hypothetical protein|nr:leucine-rich repeat domain-containing protein [Holosporales bacterium]
MKKIIITSVAALLIPEVSNCTRATDLKRITVDGVNYQEYRDGIASAAGEHPSDSFLPRNQVSMDGNAFIVSDILGLSKSARNSSGWDDRLLFVCIPRSAKTIDISCFDGCAILSYVAFEASARLTVVGGSAFSFCSALKSICIPPKVTVLEKECFSVCRALGSVVFEPNSKLMTIGKSAFFQCYFLSFIRTPSRVRTFGEQCFDYCKSLSRVEFKPDSQLATIEKGAFNRCSALKSICIPFGVQGFDEKCFEECPNLRRVIFEPGSRLRWIKGGVIPEGVEILNCPLSIPGRQ